MSQLERAVLTYGATVYSVKPNEITPLPLDFDFNSPEECARKVFAVMSNASGGHTLRDCKVRYDLERQTANLTSSGCHVFFAPKVRAKMTIEEAIAAHERTVVVALGDVVTDQYGDGWKRARWSK